MGFLMLGGPGETKDTVEESLAFAELLDPDAMKVTTGIRIYPHTPLHQLALSEGVVSSEDDLLFPKFYYLLLNFQVLYLNSLHILSFQILYKLLKLNLSYF